VVIDTISNTLTGSDSFLFRFSPFQVVPNDSLGLFFKPEEMVSYISVDAGYAGIPRTFPPYESSIFFLFFVFCFLLFSLFYRSERKTLFADFKNLLGFRKRATSVYKEQVTVREIWAEMFLLFQTLLIFSMVYFVLFWDRGIVDMLPGNRNLLFLCVFLTLGAFVFFRYVIYSFLGVVFFPLKIKNWLGKYLQIVELVGILSFFPAFFYIFLPEIASFAFVLLLAIFFMSRLGIMIAVFDIFVKNKIGFFYFIVYLCGIEILPYFLLYSGLISLISVVGSIAL
jgi:hypothetical protein